MKTDRLYALTLYRLNHGKTSASKLAKHFEVSVRTIQRDIDALCQAGFPICAFTGTNGGYEILSDFKMNKQMLQSEVKNKKVVRFSYTNNSGETRQHCVEPIAVIYKWYA